MSPFYKRSGKMVGRSEKLKRVYDLVDKAAGVELPVLIVGETGTGKDLIANEIHTRSCRRDYPFVAVNVGALSRELVVSELFGHVKGAFTGATEAKSGRFVEADRGTLFLDEIGTMEEHTQVALLRVLESKTFRALGAKTDRQADVRLVAATNINLEEALESGNFREDFYHRLQVLLIEVPPLREIPEDIPLLAYHFLRRFNEEFGFRIDTISPRVMKLLVSYHWPGNIRELKNVIAQCGVSAGSQSIEMHHLPDRVWNGNGRESSMVFGLPGAAAPVAAAPVTAEPAMRSESSDTTRRVTFPLGQRLAEVEKTYIVETLAYCANNKTRAAEVLGMSRKTLYDRLKRWNLKT